MQQKIKMILVSSGNTYRSVAPAFGLEKDASATKLSRGLKSISDLIKLCDFCDAEITIKLKDGSVIPITIKDIE